MGSLLGSNLEMHLAIVAIGHNKYITLIFDKGMAMHVMRKPTLSKEKSTFQPYLKEVRRPNYRT